MGASLTWKTEDMIRFGNCGKYLDEIVYFEFPESSGAAVDGLAGSSERDSHYVLNDAEVLQDRARGLEIPEGEGYAIEYTEMSVIKSIKEMTEIIREFAGKYPEIEQEVQENIPENEADFIADLGKLAYNQVRKFVRWVSKDEFQEKAKQAIERVDSGDNEVELTTRWYLIGQEDRNMKCKTCPLSMDLYPGHKKLGSIVNCHQGSFFDHFRGFFDYISQLGNFSVLTNEYSIMDADGRDRISKMMQLAKQHNVELPGVGESISIIYFGEIVVNELGQLEKELKISRGILEEEDSAMQAYGHIQKLFEGYVQAAKRFNIPIQIK